jgi:preprotein translocase subunit YajC
MKNKILAISAAVLAASPALAQSAPGGQGGLSETLPTLLMFGLMFVVFYVLLIRPQQKKVKEQQAMISAVRRGDRVVVSGFIGTVTRVQDDEAQLELADGVRVRVLKAAISTVLTKGEPKGGEAKPDSKEVAEG